MDNNCQPLLDSTDSVPDAKKKQELESEEDQESLVDGQGQGCLEGQEVTDDILVQNPLNKNENEDNIVGYVDQMENGPGEVEYRPEDDESLVHSYQSHVEENESDQMDQKRETDDAEYVGNIQQNSIQQEDQIRSNEDENNENMEQHIIQEESVNSVEVEKQENIEENTENDEENKKDIQKEECDDSAEVHDPTRHVHIEGTNVSSAHEGELDAEGYLIDQHQETEHFSHTREIREQVDHMEIVQQDSRCLQLKEAKSKETIRQATAEELKALLGATAFDGKDEVEIGTEIVVEGFSRVEQTHEEVDAGGVTSRSVTVTETREKEELHEDPNQPQLPSIEGNAPTNEEYKIQLEHVTGNKLPALTDGNVAIESTLPHNEPVEIESPKREPVLEPNEDKEDKENTEETAVTEETPKPAVTEEKRKSKSIVGYIKERSRSLSRNRADTIIKDDTPNEKTKKKSKKWSFLSKSESKKGLNRQSRADETDSKPPTGQADVEDSKSKLHGSAEDILREKQKGQKDRKLSFFAKQKNNVASGTHSGASTLERDPSSGGEEPRTRSWSLFRRKSDRLKDTPEKKKDGLETSKSEHSAIGGADSNRKNSTNSLQRGVKNLFGGKKEASDDVIEVEDLTESKVYSKTNAEPGPLRKDQAARRASVNSITTPAAAAGYSSVVAIDLGATVSSYAYCFTQDEPDVIHTMKKPEGSDPGICDPKFPTALLITPEGEFHSFGFNARNVYQGLDPAEADKWMYFDSFRKQLTQILDVKDDPVVKAINGLSAPAAVLLEHALKFLSYEAMQDLDAHTGGVPVGKVRWVITAPAGWHTEARHWIRHIAYKVGLATAEFPQQLLVMQEPQAAAACVHQLQVQEWQREYDQEIQLLMMKKQPEEGLTDRPAEQQQSDTQPSRKSASVSMIVNCGGDEMTVSVYEIKESSMTLLYQQISTNSGGTGVNDAFVKLLYQIFGEEFVEDYKSKKPSGWADLIIAFESCKRSLDPIKENLLNVPLPFSFIDHHQRHFGFEVSDSVEKYGEGKDIAWTQQGMLRLLPSAWLQLFQPLLDKILQAVRQAIISPATQSIEYIWLIGGFAECLSLQKSIRDSFKQLKIIVPKETSHVAVKGAVSFGMDPVRVIFSHHTSGNSTPGR